MRTILVLFVVVPILEMWLLITVGSKIGALATIGLVLLTAVVGLALLREQGLQTLLRARRKMDNDELPAQEMAEGLCLAVGGALLLTPGFLTDAIGFCLLIPGIRRALLALLVRFAGVKVVYGEHHFRSTRESAAQSGQVIEGEVVDRADEGKKIQK